MTAIPHQVVSYPQDPGPPSHHSPTSMVATLTWSSMFTNTWTTTEAINQLASITASMGEFSNSQVPFDPLADRRFLPRLEAEAPTLVTLICVLSWAGCCKFHLPYLRSMPKANHNLDISAKETATFTSAGSDGPQALSTHSQITPWASPQYSSTAHGKMLASWLLAFWEFSLEPIDGEIVYSIWLWTPRSSEISFDMGCM